MGVRQKIHSNFFRIVFCAVIYLFACGIARAQEFGGGEAQDGTRNYAIEAAAGGGFPARFGGDFFIERRGDFAWTFYFLHQTVNSLLHDTKKDFDTAETRTELRGTRRFTFYNIVLDAEASYQIGSKELQNASREMTDITRQIIFGCVNMRIQLPAGFALNALTGVSDVSRYAGLSNWFVRGMENSAAIRKIPADVLFTWDAASDDGAALKAALGVRYGAEQFDGEDFFLEHTASSAAAFYAARGFAAAGAEAGFFFDGGEFTPPFTLFVSAQSALFDDAPESGVRLLGGLRSFREDAAVIEKTNPFTWLGTLPRAASDWFFDARALLAFNGFSSSAELSFKQTAFGKGISQSNYGAPDSISGLFVFERVERAALDTRLSAAFETGMIVAALAWNAQWLYADAFIPSEAPAWDILQEALLVPSSLNYLSGGTIAHNEAFLYEKTSASYYPQFNQQNPARHTLSLSVSLVPENAPWGARAVSHFFFNANDLPYITLSAFYQFEKKQSAPKKNSVRLAAQVQDALNFILAKKRYFAEPYIAGAGNFNVFLTFSY